MRKKIISLFAIAFFLIPFFAIYPSEAGATLPSANARFGLNYLDGTAGNGDPINLGRKDPRTMVAQLVNVILTLLGIVAVGIVLLGGFKWMTAGGNEDQVSEAKKLLGAGVIGLVIILAAWGIASFVLTELMNATGN